MLSDLHNANGPFDSRRFKHLGVYFLLHRLERGAFWHTVAPLVRLSSCRARGWQVRRGWLLSRGWAVLPGPCRDSRTCRRRPPRWRQGRLSLQRHRPRRADPPELIGSRLPSTRVHVCGSRNGSNKASHSWPHASTQASHASSRAY